MSLISEYAFDREIDFLLKRLRKVLEEYEEVSDYAWYF